MFSFSQELFNGRLQPRNVLLYCDPHKPEIDAEVVMCKRPVILAGLGLVRERPDVVAALQQLTARIDGDRMRRRNLAVDQEGASPAAVAEAFLQDVREERLGR